MLLTEIPRDRWPSGPHLTIIPAKVWIGDGYLVQAYDEPGGVVRLTVNSTNHSGRNWADRTRGTTCRPSRARAATGPGTPWRSTRAPRTS